MSDQACAKLTALVAKWRAKAASRDGENSVSLYRYALCADELEAAVSQLREPEAFEPIVSEELKAKLAQIVAESKAEKDKPFTMVGPRTFVAMKDEPVVVVRQHDSLGRRHSNFCQLSVSTGIDGVAFASEIAAALQAYASTREDT